MIRVGSLAFESLLRWSLAVRRAFSYPSQNRHGSLTPHAIFLVFQRVNVEQPPSFREQPVDFLPAFGFKIVSGHFHDV